MDHTNTTLPLKAESDGVERMQSNEKSLLKTEAETSRQERSMNKSDAGSPYGKVHHVGGSLSSSALFGEMDYPGDDHCEPTEEETDFGESSASFGFAAADSSDPSIARRGSEGVSKKSLSSLALRPTSPRVRTPARLPLNEGLAFGESPHASATDVHPRWHMSFESEIFCEEEEIREMKAEESEPQHTKNINDCYIEDADEPFPTPETGDNIRKEASTEDLSQSGPVVLPDSRDDDDNKSIDHMALWYEDEDEKDESSSSTYLSAKNLPGHDSFLWGNGGGVIDPEETGRENDQYYHLQNHGLNIHHNDLSDKVTPKREDDELSFTLSQLNKNETEDDSKSSSESASFDSESSSSASSEFSLHCEAFSVTSSLTWSISSIQELEPAEVSKTSSSSRKVTQPMNPTIGSDCSSVDDSRLGHVVNNGKPMNPTIGETVDRFSKLMVSPYGESDSLQCKRNNPKLE